MMTMVISGSDGVTFPDSTNQFSGGAFSFKNRIINGDMRIDQRNAGAAVTAQSGYCVDRFGYVRFGTDELAWSLQQDSSAPTGFVNSVKVTITTAETTYTTNENTIFYQTIEGLNVADLGWGTANAKTVTLSFWVRSSLTGTFGGCLYNSAANRFYPFSYTISVADTWEQKTVTVAGDTTGTWLTTNGAGITVQWALGQGPDRLGTAGAWTSSNHQGVTGQVQVGANLNATWYVTGVQFEVGSVATPFERRPFGTELALCQRYYYRLVSSGSSSPFGSGAATTNAGVLELRFPVTMRVSPSALEQSGTAGDYALYNGATITCSSVPAFNSANTQMSHVLFTVSSGVSAGQGVVGRGQNATGYLGWSAEL
jgi:hypothetical protein